jgi:hypothetical protein
MKCPRCGYEVPKPEPPPYEYTGYLKPYLSQILALLRLGYSNNEVAETLHNLHGVVHSPWGTSPATIIGYLRRRYGFERQNTAGDPDRNREIAAKYLAGGVTLKKLGEEYGISRERIRNIIIKVERKAAQREEAERAYHAAACIENVPIEALNLSARTRNCFKNEGCQTVGDALKLSDSDLFHIPNFGRVSWRDWKQALEALRAEFNQGVSA